MKILRVKPGEKGFTLIELLVGLTIVAFVVGAVSMTIVTMMRLNPRNNDWAMALRQVQNASFWICRDVQMSRGTIDVNPEPDTFLTLVLPYEDAGGTIVTKTVDYQFENLSGEEWLTRSDEVEGTTAIAQLITGATAIYSENCTDNCTLTFTIGATSGNTNVSHQYQTTQRVPAPP
jgi:prepilin-type N-terminal cleavage/methylation domain-containing protein